MNIHNMTPAQLRALADQKEQENHQPTHVGYLKHDLYESHFDENVNLTCGLKGFWLYNQREMEMARRKLSKKIKESFKLVLHAGTRFDRYFIDGCAAWTDSENFGVQEMCDDWAHEYLEGITEC